MDAQPTALVIRVARPDDAPTLLEIQREASVAAFAHVFDPERYPYPSDQVLSLWNETLADPEMEVYVGELDGAPAGVVTIGNEFLSQLYVLPSRQQGGIGTALHDHALARLGARGISRAKLWTLEGNHGARRFYERRGWELTEETRVVPYPPNPIDVQYAKDL